MKQQQFQQQMQNKPKIGSGSGSKPQGEGKNIETLGNDETKILAAAVGAALKSGGIITAKEKEAIKNMDTIFENVDVLLSKDGKNAYFVQADGKSFKMNNEIVR